MSRQPGEAPVQRNDYLYWVTKVVLTPPLLVALRPKVEGLRHVPTSGPAILASNHTSFYDWLVLPLVVPRRRIIFLAKSSYFTGRGLKGRLRRFFFTACGQVPVDRSGGGAGEAALRTAARLLGEGNLLGVFPEGTRSPDRRLHRGRTGVVRMAAASGATRRAVRLRRPVLHRPHGSGAAAPEAATHGRAVRAADGLAGRPVRGTAATRGAAGPYGRADGGDPGAVRAGLQRRRRPARRRAGAAVTRLLHVSLSSGSPVQPSAGRSHPDVPVGGDAAAVVPPCRAS